MTALDPVYTIGAQIDETIVRHEGVSHKAARRRALELLDLVQIPSPARRLAAYPHEMSGGMRQRAMIALALSCRPSILLADEPTTALDVTVQIQIIVLLRQLQRELGMAVVFVTHDVGRRRRGRRPPRGHVRRPLCRDRADRHGDPPAAPSVHGGTARPRPCWARRRASASTRSRAPRPTSRCCLPAAASRPAAATPTRGVVSTCRRKSRSPPTTWFAVCGSPSERSRSHRQSSASCRLGTQPRALSSSSPGRRRPLLRCPAEARAHSQAYDTEARHRLWRSASFVLVARIPAGPVRARGGGLTVFRLRKGSRGFTEREPPKKRLTALHLANRDIAQAEGQIGEAPNGR